MRPERAWIRLQSGRRLDLLQPAPDSWTDRDLAIGLSRTYRWGGHSCWDLPLSVAQHSLLVLVLRQKLTPLDKLTRGEALRELLHDADEGMLSNPANPATTSPQPLTPYVGYLLAAALAKPGAHLSALPQQGAVLGFQSALPDGQVAVALINTSTSAGAQAATARIGRDSPSGRYFRRGR